MKILLLPPYFTPEIMASSHLDHDRYNAFAAEGWDMHLYTPMPTRGINADERLKYKKIRKERMYDDKMHVHRFSMFQEKKGAILRAIRYVLCFIKQLWFGLRTKDIDVVYLVSTPPIQGLIGALLKKIRKVPFVYNLQDIFPDSMVGAGMTKENSLLWKVGRKIENFTYRHADKIIVISEDFRENLLQKGVPNNKIEVVYNWVDSDVVYPIKEQDNILFEELGLSRDDNFRVVYAGNFGLAQNIDVIIDTAEILQSNSDIQFLLFGQGETYERYKEQVSKRGLKNIVFQPLQPVDKVKYVYSLGDLGIVSCKPGIGKGAFPSKTWSILSAGVPVVANYDEGTDLEHLLSQNKLGVFSPSGKSKEMADAILKMYNNPILCKEFGINAREYVLKNASREVAVGEYVRIIKEVVSNEKTI